MNIASKKIEITYLEYNSIDELPENDKLLVQKALLASENAHAPYSCFKVGAAVELSNGKYITGSNQENIVFPSGLCAERVALFAASHNYPKTTIKSIAIAAQNKSREIAPASPCGSCRQVLAEYENLLKQPIRVLFCGENGKILLFNSVEDMLPLQFKY